MAHVVVIGAGIGGMPAAYELRELLPKPHAVSAARVSLPSDKSFASYAEAQANLGGPPLDGVLEVTQVPGGEAPGDDAAQPGVAGIVHVDHAAEEFVELGRQRLDRRGAGGRAEELGVATRLEDVGVAPDVTVPFDIRYAAGADPQREAAIEALVDSLATEGTTVQ